MRLSEYVFQDVRLRYRDNGIWKNMLRYFRIPGYKILVNYRFVQYIGKQYGGIIYGFSRLHLERLNAKFLTLINEELQCGPGLFFPHNGPFIINSASKIGRFCTIHPNVLIGGNRGKGAPVIGNYCFIGNGSKIIGNVHVGDWCFISPGAMITKDIPDRSVVGYGLNNILSGDGEFHVRLYL